MTGHNGRRRAVGSRGEQDPVLPSVAHPGCEEANPLINVALRLALILWVLGYVAVACAPLVTGDVGSGLAGMLVGGILFIPWLIILIVLGALVWLTGPTGTTRR